MSRPAVSQLFFILLCCFYGYLTPLAYADTTETPTVQGGTDYEIPSWFKESFLELKDDASEAAAANKHVLLFFHLNQCPYCARMLRESFETEPMKSDIQQHFDVIAINIRGAREVAFNETTSLTEQALARDLKVQYTPTILFLDGNNNAVARLNGYRSPAQFKQVLNFVKDKGYTQGSLADYLAAHPQENVYTLRADPLFQNITDFSKLTTPLAVIFEDSQCVDCAEFHEQLLARPEVREELQKFTVVRLDANATDPIIAPDGTQTTPKAWAATLNMAYRPGIVLFNEGKEAMRIDNRLYSFHFKEVFRYVSGGHYKTASRFGEYLGARQQELKDAGISINIAE